MKQLFRYISVVIMLLTSMTVSAQSTIKVMTMTNGTVTTDKNSASKNETVTLTVTPSDGYYFQKEDLEVVKTVNPNFSRTRGEIPVSGSISVSGSDPADLSVARSYTFTVPDDGYELQVSATFTARTSITDDMVTLSASSFTYNGSDQKPTVSINGLTEGTDYSVSFAESAWKEVGTYSVSVSGKSTYQGTVTKTFTISSADGSLTPPTGKSGLVYTGAAQDLITAGSSTTGTMQYSLDGTNYSASIPQGTDAKDYTVYYKVVANAGYNDVGPSSFKVTISPKTLSSPTITLSQTSYTYDGQAKEPTVTVKDGETTIPATEYAVSYSNNTEVGTATVTITDKVGGNYTVSGSATFSISSADGSLTPPTGKSGLVYTGAAQDLITAGSSTTGTMQYSLDGTNYSASIPQGTDAKDYTVYYKVVANAGYNDVGPSSFKVTISPKTLSSPTITLSQTSYTYDGQAKEPTVTVKDGDATIPASEYAVSYTNNTNVGTATVTITDTDGGNYIVSGSTTFSIASADGSLTPPTGKSGLVYSGAAQDLITAGSSTTGTIQYSLDGTNYGTSIPQGTDAKEYTVYYKVVASPGYNDVAPASFKVTISPKTVSSPTITLSQTSYTYDGNAKEPTATVKDGDATIPASEYAVSYTNNTNVGTATVTITDTDGGNYIVSGSTTFSIASADGSLTPPTGKSGLVYTGAAQDLITAGSSTTGTMQYSLDGTNYNASIPQGTDAKDYTVYYKVVANAGYNDVGPSSFKVTISPKTLSSPTITLSETSYTYDGQAKEPTVTVKDGDATIPASEYTVSYKDNKEVGTATVTITDKEGGNYTVSGSATFSITAPETPSIVNNDEPVTVDGQTLYEPSEEVVEAIKETIETDIALPAAAEGRVEVTDDGGLKFSQGEDLFVALLDLKLKDIVKFIFTGRLFGDSSKLRLKNGNGGGTRAAGDMELISEAEYEVIEAGDQMVTVKLEEAEATVETIIVTESEKAVSVKISSAKQVAYCSDQDLDFMSYDHLKAYVATGYDKTTGTIWLTRVKDVPANTGFLLMGDPGTYDVPVKEGGSNSYYTNMFKGTIEATTIQTTETIDGKEYTNYYLSNGDQGVGFYKVTKTGGQSLPANRAYLSVPSGIPAVGSAGSTETIKVTAAGQVPYYSANSLDFTDMADVKAYTATGYDYKSGTIWLTRVKKVPALTGLLIMAPEGSYPIPTTSVATVYGNMFKGTLGGTTIQATETIAGVDYINYYLSNGNYGVGFYKVTKAGGQPLGENRSYLSIPKQPTAGTRSVDNDPTHFGFQESDEVIALRVFGSADGTTDIETNNREPITNNHWYNLQGQRVENPGKGLYIRNGVKVVIR